MTDKSIGIIYAIKQCYGIKYGVRQFLQEYCNDKYYYSHEYISSILRETVLDYLLSCDDWKTELRRFFNTYEDTFCDDDYDVCTSFLFDIQVVKFNEEKSYYINGFKDNPFKHFRIFNNRGKF